jgi:hypothetical protein
MTAIGNSPAMKNWQQYLGLTFLAVAAYLFLNRVAHYPVLDILSVLCILQVICVKTDRTRFIASAVMVFLIIAGSTFVIPIDLNMPAAKESADKLNPLIIDGFNLSFLGFCIAGLLFVNLFNKPYMRVLNRILVVTGVSFVLTVVILFFITGNGAMMQELENFMSTQNAVLLKLHQETPNALTPYFPPEALHTYIKDIIWVSFTSNFTYFFFIVLVFAYWAGSRLGNMRGMPLQGMPSVAQFTLNPSFVWVLIATLAVILASGLLNLFVITGIAANLLLIVLTLYGIQGAGISKHLTVKYNISRSMQMIMLLGFVMMVVFSPAVNLIVCIALPCLGVSETWIKFRKEN